MDVERMRLANGEAWDGKVPQSKRPPRHRSGERFLRGPIPSAWLERAGNLPGKTLHVAVALWFQAGITKKRTVKLSYKDLARLGCKHEAGRRALKRLEAAGLVEVDSQNGRSPVVTILEAPKKTP